MAIEFSRSPLLTWQGISFLNARCFEGLELNLAKLKCVIVKFLYDWTSTSSSFSVEGLLYFLDSLGWH
jgi:hypothetical protein